MPALLSFPHFLYADDKYLNYVTGMNPSVEKHDTFAHLEPVSSAFLKLQ